MAATQAVFAFRDEGATTDRAVLVTRLIDGSFPNYEQVIPSESQLKAVVEREALLESLRRVSILASEKSSPIRLHFKKKSLTISVTTPDVGEAEEVIDAEFSGDSIEVGFNPGYLMDPLRNLDSDKITLELTDELSPGVVRCAEPFLYVLMPMRIA
jgi:DNA polymerase-3 subunit beta